MDMYTILISPAARKKQSEKHCFTSLCLDALNRTTKGWIKNDTGKKKSHRTLSWLVHLVSPLSSPQRRNSPWQTSALENSEHWWVSSWLAVSFIVPISRKGSASSASYLEQCLTTNRGLRSYHASTTRTSWAKSWRSAVQKLATYIFIEQDISRLREIVLPMSFSRCTRFWQYNTMVH